MRRGLRDSRRAIADARARAIRSIEAARAAMQPWEPDPDAPAWLLPMQRLAHEVAAATAPTQVIGARAVLAKDLARAALLLWTADAAAQGEAGRSALAVLAGADPIEQRRDRPPDDGSPGLQAVAVLCDAPRPGPLAALAA